MSRETGGPAENIRLDSWKEIAVFFGRDERTVKRWEKTRSLPVHRLPGNQRGGVFAYSHELTQWLNSESAESDNSDGSLRPEEPFDSPPVFVERRRQPEPQPAAEPEIERTGHAPPANLWTMMAAAVLIAVLIAVAVLINRRRTHAFTAPSSPTPTVTAVHSRPPPDRRAVEFYLRGRYYWNRRTGDSLNRAVDAFTQAIVIDPSYAEAYAGLADSYNLMREYTTMPESEAYPRAIAAATKAVALDDSLAEAHRALAFALFYWKWDVPKAQQQYEKAIQLDPKDADAHHWYATSFLSLGRNSDALYEIQRARALSPGSPSILADRALILYESGDRAAGLAALKEMSQSEPQFLSPPRYLAKIYFEDGDYPDFLEMEKRAAILSSDPQEEAIADAARRGWQAGGERRMLEAMAAAQRQVFDKGQSSGYRLAYVCLLLGRKKDAVHYLQAALAAHDANILNLPRSRFAAQLNGDPDFERLKAEVRAYTDRTLPRRSAL